MWDLLLWHFIHLSKTIKLIGVFSHEQSRDLTKETENWMSLVTGGSHIQLLGYYP